MRSEHRRAQRIDAAADGEPGGEEERENQEPDARLLHAELAGQGEAGVVQAAQDRPGRNGEEAGDLGDGHVEEIVQQQDLAHIVRKRRDGVPQERGVDVAEEPFGRIRVRGPRHGVGIRALGAVRLAADVRGVEVGQDLAHPPEEGGLLDVSVDALHDGREGAVHELLGVALVGAEAAREGHQARAVLAFQAPGAALAVPPQFFDDRFHAVGRCGAERPLTYWV